MDKHLSKLLPILMILVIAGSAIFVANNLDRQTTTLSQAAPNGLPTLIPDSQITSQSSPDGKELLTMKKQVADNVTTYTFTTNQGILFSKTVNKNVVFTIPFNTWSPDDKYVFVKEDTGNIINYLVYPQGVNVTDFFVQKLPTFKLVDITGWASGTLLILNTSNSDGSEGPSFWFDLPSKSFIRLSTRFN